MSDNTTVLESVGITMDANGLAKAAEEYRKRHAIVTAALSAAKDRTSTERARIEGEVSDGAREFADSVLFDADEVTNWLDVQIVAVLDRMESLSDFLSDVLDERISERIEKTGTDALSDAKTAHSEASALKEFAEGIAPLLRQMGADVSKYVKVSEKTGNVLLDKDVFPKLRNVDSVSPSTGTRDYTKRLPIFTVNGEALPWGTTWRKVATAHLPNVEIGARDLMEMVRDTGVDYVSEAWSIEIDGNTLHGTAYMTEAEASE